MLAPYHQGATPPISHPAKLWHMTPPEIVLSRIKSKTIVVGSCFIWIGLTDKGYGKISYNNKTYRVHRLVWELLINKCPANLVADHLCRNRACWNPNHLEWVTNKENILRGRSPSAKNALKTHCCNGHELIESNLKRRSNRSYRECLTCSRERRRVAFRASRPDTPG